MKSIKAKINLSLFLIIGTAVGFGGLAFQENRQLETIQQKVSSSLSMRDEINDLDPKENSEEVFNKLKSFKGKVSGDDRREAISNLLQAYNAKNPRLFETRVREFESAEKDFFKVAQWNIRKLKKSIYFYLVMGTFLPLMGLLGLLYYFNFGILGPLQGLSNRMMEFLIDQYTFRFSTPANNEIGNLERTFNSLAQKVLNNMDELKALDRAKSEFVSIASHELRTPLTSIKGSLGLLSNGIVGELDPESKEMVLVAEQETDRLVRLINDMLDLAKIESHSLTLKREWQSLDDLLERTAQGLQGFATAAQVTIKISNRASEVEANLDADRIQQVLTNLISNAIKYSPENGVVTLGCQKIISGDLEISITDQGQGISDENQKMIFEKFTQATDSSNHLVKGTGLGLAISKALIEEHNGQIGVRSKPGHGATFYFNLPEWRPASTANEQKAA